MTRYTSCSWILIALVAALSHNLFAQPAVQAPDDEVLTHMLDLVSTDNKKQKKAARWLGDLKDISVVPAFIDAMQLVKFPSEFDKVLRDLTDQKIDYNWPKWHLWLIEQQDFQAHPAYRSFKRALFTGVDPDIGRLLDLQHPGSIRWEEIVWGGVKRDAIPPLDQPLSMAADKAFYMKDSEEVFGISVGGKSLAFPVRILEWHEMANVVIAGTPVSLVYCVLCGTAIAYHGQLENGRQYDFGTSGLLYRSNKLMYDRQTRSLWSSFDGQPVIGPLINRNIRLKRLPVVRTSWRDWVLRHPDTRVLDIETGFDRQYKGNQHYQAYLRSNRMMFPVAGQDKRLKAKDWVYGLDMSGAEKAYPVNDLKDYPVLNDRVAATNVVLIRDDKFTIRAYYRGEYHFQATESRGMISDANGAQWEVREDQLFLTDDKKLERIPGQLAFWFAWYAFHPETAVFGKTAAE